MNNTQQQSDAVAYSSRRQRQAMKSIWAAFGTAPSWVMAVIAIQNWTPALLHILGWQVTLPIGALVLAALAIGLVVGIWCGWESRREQVQDRFRDALYGKDPGAALSSPEAIAQIEKLVGPFRY